MSYNTRRGGPNPASPQVPSVASIGQRRPVANNFVSGGQLNAQTKGGAQKPGQQQQQARAAQQPTQVTSTTINYRTQNQGYQTVQQKAPQQPQPQQVIKAEPQPQTPLAGVNPPNPVLESANGDNMETDQSESQKKKPIWAKGGKISKKEKTRRRNVRLSRMLQPKNAVMILNELVKNTSYSVEENPNKTDGNQFKATVVVEDLEHVGHGQSKIHAKNSAAEAALRHLIKSNRFSEMKKEDESTEKMEVEDGTQPPLPWQHIASFALFKLFTSWGEDPSKNQLNKLQAPTAANPETNKTQEHQPAKKMPANPETMNPLVLINQMLPQAQFEEIGMSGSPPNITYSYRCNVNGQSFIGTGSNKKTAKKMAAFGACHKILNIVYPQEVYVPIY